MTERRPAGTGSIVEVSPGVWRVRAFAGRDPITNKKRQIERTVRGNKTAATDQWKALQKKIDSGERGGSNAKLAFVLEEYAKHSEGRGRAPRYVADIRRITSQVLPVEYQNLSIDKLTTRHLDELYWRLRTGDVKVERRGKLVALKAGPSSIHRYHAIISAALGQAVKWGWLDRSKNPADLVGLPEIPEPEEERRTPTPVECQRFIIEAAKFRDEYGMLVLLAVATATRLGEFCAIRWTHIDTTAGAIRVRRSLYRVGATRGEKETKGKRGRRIALDPQLAFLLLRWRERCEKRAAEHGVSLVPDAFIVSSVPDGSRPINPETFSAFQSRLAKKLGINLSAAGRNPFRHAGGTEILAATGSPRDGADMLGHADPAFFLRQYTHATTDRQIAAAGVLANMLPSPADLDFAKD